MKSIAAVSFSYCVFLGTQEASAFSQAKIPVGGLVSSAVVSKSSLGASSGQHDGTCPCSMCNVGRDIAAVRREENSGRPVLGRAHGPGCPCDSCSQSVGAAHRAGCDCGACSQHGAGCDCGACSQHGAGCDCGACSQTRAPRGCGCSGACKC